MEYSSPESPAAYLGVVAQAGQMAGSSPHRPGMLQAADWSGPLEPALARRQAGRAGDCRGRRLVSDRAPPAEKNALKPHLRRQWCIPPEANGDFVWRMEDVLEVYTRPYDSRRPLVCLDETSKQLLRDTRAGRH